ncbi:MAG TPA: hypothetical protein VF711_00730 [Acidimicrobiales bacterium]
MPRSAVEATLASLREGGEGGHEVFVLWGARVQDTVLRFGSVLVPEQTAYRTSHGLLVTVEGSALFSVNKTLYERNEILAAQVHSHPTEAYHSDTDDCHSLVTLNGAVSVVVPYFGREGLAGINDWAWFRLTGKARWRPLNESERVVLVNAA